MSRFALIVAGCVSCTAFTLTAPSGAADISSAQFKAPTSSTGFDWAGTYLGGHVGYGRGAATTIVDTPSGNSFGSLFAGFQLGHSFLLPSKLLLGIEGDISFANFWLDDQIAVRVTPTTEVSEQVDYIARLRARLGIPLDHWLLYGTVGLSWSQARLIEQPGSVPDGDKVLRNRLGWNIGIGGEIAVSRNWTARLEYLYDAFDKLSADFPAGTHYQSRFDLHTVRLGLNYKLGAGPQDAVRYTDNIGFSPPGVDWNVHGQTTFIGQAYPSFRSPYEGANSLSGARQAKNTTSATAFLGSVVRATRTPRDPECSGRTVLGLARCGFTVVSTCGLVNSVAVN